MSRRRNVSGLLWRAVAGSAVILMGLMSPSVVAAKPEVVWEFSEIGAVSALTVGPDGTVYAGSEDGHLYALTPDGEKKWAFFAGSKVWAEPAIGPSGTIYIGSYEGTYALTPQGQEKWRTDLGASPTLGSDGTIYVVSPIEEGLYALSPDGKKQWGRPFPNTSSEGAGPWNYKPVIGPSGTIYVAGMRYLYAVRPDGTTKWVHEATYDGAHVMIGGSPAVGPVGMIYLAQARLRALTPGGTPAWDLEMGGGWLFSPAVGPSGNVYVSASETLCTAINPAWAIWSVLGIDIGTVWTWDRSGDVPVTGPEVASDGTVYIGTRSSVHAITAEGKHKWRYPVDHAGSIAIGNQGRIYVGSQKRLYALEAGP